MNNQVKEIKVVKRTNVEDELKRQKVEQIISTTVKYFFLGVMALFIIIPFYWMLSLSIRTTAEVNQGFINFFPESFTLDHYLDVINPKETNLLRAFGNTMIVGIASTLLGTIVSIFAGFALGRLSFPGRDAVFMVLLATMMIPGEMMVLTNYITVNSLGWNATMHTQGFSAGPYYAMVFPFLVGVFHIYLLRNNFKQVPDELYLAAKVDGTSDFKYLTKVLLPMASSSLVSIIIMKLIGAWNSYAWPNLVGGSSEYGLVTAVLRHGFVDASGERSNPAPQMAAVVWVITPLMITFLIFRKYIMRGVSRSGIKG